MYIAVFSPCLIINDIRAFRLAGFLRSRACEIYLPLFVSKLHNFRAWTAINPLYTEVGR
jgi:hypothetical protein